MVDYRIRLIADLGVSFGTYIFLPKNVLLKKRIFRERGKRRISTNLLLSARENQGAQATKEKQLTKILKKRGWEQAPLA